jgi:hypothetical protein
MAVAGSSSEYSVFPSSAALALALGLVDADADADPVVACARLLAAVDALPPVLHPAAASTSKPLEHPSRPLRQRRMAKNANR